ncbi:xylosylprotein 4-beta-galactosyltransferase-like [Planococcus citri]|uniref:xylosylprotein 4-beta-galactosyltransferase-like n=1 Tax=Planococcus citri TaxID=170843 RepID=UPI0031F89CCF
MAYLISVFKRKKTLALCFTCLGIFSCFLLFLMTAPCIRKITFEKPPEHTLCVLVPFRDAFEELLEFIPHMNEFLNRQKIKFYFVVVNHAEDGNRFNKGSVFNAGFEFISKQYPDCNYIALHDIDLLPLNDEIPYQYPGDDVYNVANPDYHPRGEKYDPERYVGGILLISIEQYIRVNGLGNNFWGWGGEDRNFYYRLSNNSIARIRPENLSTDRSNTFKNIHSPNRSRDFTRKCSSGVKKQKKDNIEYDFQSGLHDVKYELQSVHSFRMDQVPFTLYSISVPCDYSKTPWCKSTC